MIIQCLADMELEMKDLKHALDNPRNPSKVMMEKNQWWILKTLTQSISEMKQITDSLLY